MEKEKETFTFSVKFNNVSLENMKKVLANITNNEFNTEFLDNNDLIEELFDNGEIDYKEYSRTEKEVIDYCSEAEEKVWLMRNYDIYDKKALHKVSEKPAKAILKKYDDIPKIGYDDWECGFWNGVLATTRWCLGDERKDDLDT